MGTKNSVSTATQTPPKWVQSGYQDLFKDAGKLADKNYRPYTGGFTPDQQAAFQSLRTAQGSSQPYFNSAAQSYGQGNGVLGNAQNYFGGAADYYGAGSNLINSGAGLIGQGAGYLGSSAGALNASANTLNSAAGVYGSAITPSYQRVNDYMNPYVQNVINATMANMQETNARQQQDVLGNAASRGALGGNRVGVAQAELARQQGLANNQTISGLWNDAYAQALGAAQQQQQAELSGAGGLTGVGQAQQGIGQGLLGIGSGYGNLGGGLVGAGQGLYGAGQGYTGIGQGLTGVGQTYAGIGQGQTQLGGQASDTNLAQIAAQLGAGTQQQQFDYQQYLNKLAFPYQQQSWLSGIYGGIGPNAGGQTVSQVPQGNLLSQIIGGVIGGASLFSANGGRIPGRAGGGVVPYRNDNQEWPGASFNLSPYANDNSNTTFGSYIPEAGETSYTRASYPSTQDYELDDPFAEGKQGASTARGVGTWIRGGLFNDEDSGYADGGVVRFMTKGREQSENIEDIRPPKKSNWRNHDPITDLIESILNDMGSNDNDMPAPPMPRRRANASPFTTPDDYDPLTPYRDPGANEHFQARAGGGVVPDDRYSAWRNTQSVLGFLPKPPPLETAGSTRAGSVYGGQFQPQPFSSPTDRMVQTIDVDRFGNMKPPSPMLNSGANSLGLQGTKHPRGFEVPAYNSLNEPWPGEYDLTLSPGTYRRNGDIIQNNPVGLMSGPVDAADVVLDNSNLGLPKREPIDITVRGGNHPVFQPGMRGRGMGPSTSDMVWEEASPSGVVPADGDPWGGNMRMGAQALDGFGSTPGLVTGRAPVSGMGPAPTNNLSVARARARAPDKTFAQNRAIADNALAIDMGGGSTRPQRGTQSSYGMNNKQWSKFLKMTPGADRTKFIQKVRTNGKAYGGVVRPEYAPGGVIGDVPYSTGDQFVTEPAPGYSQSIGDVFNSLKEGNGLNLAPDFRQAMLAAGAGMMASRSPFALQGIGEGALKGVQAWNDRQALERENARARSDIANTTKQTAIQQQLTNAQVPLMGAQTQAARYIVRPTPLGMQVVDLFNVAEPKLYKWGSMLPNGELATPGGDTQTSDGGYQPLFDVSGKGGNDDMRLMVQEAVPGVYAETDRTMQDAQGRYTSATGAQAQLTEMRHTLDKLPEDGFLTPGTNFEDRVAFARSINTVANVLGMDPLIDEKEVAAGEEMTKVAKRLGFELTNTFQNTGAAQIVEDAISAVPSGANSREGAEVIINSLEAFNQRAMDWSEFLNNWVQGHSGSSLGAAVAFNKTNPPELYALSAYVPDEAMMLLRQKPDLVDAFNAKYGHGRDVAQYVLAAARGAQGG